MKRSRRNYTSPTVRREYYVNGRRFRSMATAKRHAVKLAKKTSSDVEIEGYDGRGYKVSSQMIGPPGVPAWAKGIKANPRTRAKTLRADKWIRLPAGATHVKVSRSGTVQAGVPGTRTRKANPKRMTAASRKRTKRNAARRANPLPKQYWEDLFYYDIEKVRAGSGGRGDRYPYVLTRVDKNGVSQGRPYKTIQEAKTAAETSAGRRLSWHGTASGWRTTEMKTNPHRRRKAAARNPKSQTIYRIINDDTKTFYPGLYRSRIVALKAASALSDKHPGVNIAVETTGNRKIVRRFYNYQK